MADSQAIEGYGCSCGYKTDDLGQFRRHFVTIGRAEKGQHKSLGRINLSTGDKILPPYTERTAEEKLSTKFGIHKDKSDKKSTETTRITDNFGEAAEIKFVPRVYTATLSPIMQTAMVAAQRVWGWRPDMPLINFIDTVIYNFFKEHGITLAAYIVDEKAKGDGHKETEELQEELSELAGDRPDA